ncbi:MAG: hypothetical protein IJ471_09630 [Eubacterium sp.]|nr:hypothetical protein [Eubacterium sp.]
MNDRERIAWKIAQDLTDGEFVSFGHGIPYLVGKYIPREYQIYIQIESGVVCFGEGTPADLGDYEMRDSVNHFVKDNVGGSFFDCMLSFQMIRGKHLDKSVMGAFQVDCQGNFANWRLPGCPANGIGGAMDLAIGAKEIIIAMESALKDGTSKLVELCDYPITGRNVVSKVYTEFGVLQIKDGKFILIEHFSDYPAEQIIDMINGPCEIAPGLKRIDCIDIN